MDLWLTGRIYCFLPFEASPVFIPVKVGGSEIFFFPLIQVFFFFPLASFPERLSLQRIQLPVPEM